MNNLSACTNIQVYVIDGSNIFMECTFCTIYNYPKVIGSSAENICYFTK